MEAASPDKPAIQPSESALLVSKSGGGEEDFGSKPAAVKNEPDTVKTEEEKKADGSSP